ncbi:cellulase family glycosylhydrolase [Mesorhizobium sp. BAC0120]|uniref:glycoside hydrolase family 5 protein n=1 Tax=Mesorhizobium sp. BAC0120 TaxID=3090670 RepID=UPI00298CBCE9|nr:cellulase family glycosylhydrolase [Mesorhizobium sp. BAC0120]MDW6021901.1 cellulase family glycosylhydrolase [Mesorhizobium sp. BAC0120]
MLLATAATQTHAATFSMKRGLNLDIWQTWPDKYRWADPDVLLPYPEWRKSLKESDLAALKEAGFDFLRMPVDPSPFLAEETEGFRDRLVASVVESARLINKVGLKVVVDMHLIPAGGKRGPGMAEVMSDPRMFDRYVELVRTMARALSGEDPTLVAFEPMNEPVIDCERDGTDHWPERLQRLYAAARASATRLTLMLTGACYSSAEMLARIDPKAIPDDNVIWVFHSYDPFLLTHQGATWAADFIRYVTGLSYPPYAVPRSELDAALDKIRQRIRNEAPWSRRQGMLEYLDEQIATIDTKEKLDAVIARPFEIAAKWARENGIKPQNVYLGEFGMIRQEYGNPFVMPAAERAAYIKDMIGQAERHGFPWSIWEYGGSFGIVEEFGERKAEPEVMDMMRSLPPAR